MDKIKPLDLVFFKGRDILSDSIMTVEYTVGKRRMSLYSHVGVVVDKDILPIPEIEKDRLYIMESTLAVKYPTSGNIPKDVRGKDRFGVQIRVLEDVLQHYNGSVSIAPLVTDVDMNLAREKTMKVWEGYKDGRYAGDVISLLSTAFRFLRRPARVTRCIYTKMGKLIHIGEPDEPYVMCSQLVCILYKELGLIPDDIDPHTVMPLDFLGIRDSFPVVVGEFIHTS